MLVGNKAEAEEIPLPQIESSLVTIIQTEISLQSNQQLNNQCQEGVFEPQNIPIELLDEARKSDNGTVLSKEKHKLGTNCVAYVKEKYPKLPQGLWTLRNKKDKLINSREPEIGSVALTEEGRVGHVMIIIEILEDALVVEEGNFIHGYKTIRKISKKLPIGYYKVDNQDKS